MQPEEPFRALTSASNLYRRKLCPGSAIAEEALIELKSSKASVQGTILHDREATDDLSADDLKAAEQRALAKNRRLTDDFIAAKLQALGIADPGERKVYKEREFFLCDDKGEPVYPPVPGHADEIVSFPAHRIVFVFDSKFGRYPVTRAELNYQLRCYAVMIHDDIGGDVIYAAIRQPYLPAPLDFHAVEYRAEDVAAARKELLEVIAETKKSEAKRAPSLDACMFCRARGTVRCPESMVFIKDVLRAKVMQLHPHKLEQMGPEMKMAIRVADAWYERIRYIGEKYPELLKLYELGDQQFVHTVTDPAQAASRFSADFDGADGFMRACCKVSIPKLAMHLSKSRGVPYDEAEKAIFSELGDILQATPKERMVNFRKVRR